MAAAARAVIVRIFLSTFSLYAIVVFQAIVFLYGRLGAVKTVS
jgi:hypothetical protein